MTSRPLIGVSSGILHPDPDRTLFDGRELQFVEWSMVDWIARAGGIAVALPYPFQFDDAYYDELVESLDGIVLHGGADVAPESYGETPLRPEWSGDIKRDRHELQITKAALRSGTPVLGICRGHQLLNVALGGSLFQDIGTQVDGALNHRDAVAYETNKHDISIEDDSTLSALYGTTTGRINSVHHQAVARLGDGLIIEAHSPVDGVVEAVWLESDSAWARGVQWHPEFQRPTGDEDLLDPIPLLHDLFEAIRS